MARRETIESIFEKLAGSFDAPVWIESSKNWVFNNAGKKIPSGFWGIWRKSKETVKKHGFYVYKLDESPEGKVVYEIVFKSKEKNIDFQKVIEGLKNDIEMQTT